MNTHLLSHVHNRDTNTSKFYELGLSSVLISAGGCSVWLDDACAKLNGEAELEGEAVVNPFRIARTESTITASMPFVTWSCA